VLVHWSSASAAHHLAIEHRSKDQPSVSMPVYLGDGVARKQHSYLNAVSVNKPTCTTTDKLWIIFSHEGLEAVVTRRRVLQEFITSNASS
jgi:hypothetical protein